MIEWIYLSGAILFEVAGTTAMKISNGFTKVIPSILVGIFYILSLSLLTMTLKKIDISIAYAIWSGLGTALITIIGIYYFRESVSILKIISILLIIIGVVGLHISNKL